MQSFTIETRRRTQLVAITAQVESAVRALGRREGVATVFVPHTTAGVTINENADPDVAADLEQAMERLVPQEAGYARMPRATARRTCAPAWRAPRAASRWSTAVCASARGRGSISASSTVHARARCGCCRRLLEHVAGGHPAAVLSVLMVLAMLLSSLMNNAATAAVMCPIAFGMAEALEVRPDGLLMAVAIGASCAFLTPIAHQNNTLILGPGGFRFGDYWRLGLPLELVTLAIGVPLILRHWPLR